MTDHDHHDHGDHRHDHEEIGHSERPGYYDVMETAVRELLIERGLIGADEIRRQIDGGMFGQTPVDGTRAIATVAGVSPAAGETVQLDLAMDEAHLFDKQGLAHHASAQGAVA